MHIRSKSLFLKITFLSLFSISLGYLEIIDLLKEVFVEKTKRGVEMPSKVGLYARPDSFFHGMPAYIANMKAAGIKWVSAYPENQKRGLPNINGLIILNQIETGLPYAIMDSSWITAYRTAAATILAAKYLALPDSRTVGILACGVQGRTNLEILANFFPISRVYAYDIVPSVQKKFVEEMAVKTGIEVVGVDRPQQAVICSDIIITSCPRRKKTKPAIRYQMIKELFDTIPNFPDKSQFRHGSRHT